MRNSNEIYKTIYDLMVYEDVTPFQLATMTNSSKSAAYEWINLSKDEKSGKYQRVMNIDNLIRIANALDVSVDEILTGRLEDGRNISELAKGSSFYARFLTARESYFVLDPGLLLQQNALFILREFIHDRMKFVRLVKDAKEGKAIDVRELVSVSLRLKAYYFLDTDHIRFRYIDGKWLKNLHEKKKTISTEYYLPDASKVVLLAHGSEARELREEYLATCDARDLALLVTAYGELKAISNRSKTIRIYDQGEGHPYPGLSDERQLIYQSLVDAGCQF